MDGTLWQTIFTSVAGIVAVLLTALINTAFKRIDENTKNLNAFRAETQSQLDEARRKLGSHATVIALLQSQVQTPAEKRELIELVAVVRQLTTTVQALHDDHRRLVPQLSKIEIALKDGQA